MLSQAGAVAAQRPLWSGELVAFLDCAGLGECMPGAPTAATDSRVTSAAAQGALLAYRELFIELIPLRAMLAEAARSYRSLNPAIPFSGPAFRGFLESGMGRPAALAYVQGLAGLFDELEKMDLRHRDLEDAWFQILEEIVPPSVDLYEFARAVRVRS
jgi:hypothetical protein